ncbi:MAG: ubiquitin family protein [Planctomycetota bacterium]|jgi:sulfur carrier protein ThiS
MKVLFINNLGAGFADYIQIEEGTTIEKFFKNNMKGEQTSDHLIRVNRQPVPREYVLKDGDRITITPVKIEGAA